MVAVVPVRTVASTATTATCHPSTSAQPVMTPSHAPTPSGCRCSGSARSPISYQLPTSTSSSTRSRADSLPDACWRATLPSPPNLQRVGAEPVQLCHEGSHVTGGRGHVAAGELWLQRRGFERGARRLLRRHDADITVRHTAGSTSYGA